jgi:hypothetical protein
MGNIQKLHSLYSKKRASFFTAIEKDTNETIINKAVHAALVADLTMVTLESFISDLSKLQAYIKRETEFFLNNDKEIIKSVNTSYDLAQSISDIELKNNILDMNKALLFYEKQSRESVPLLFEIQILIITTSLNVSIETLINIFESEDPEFVQAALVRLLLNIIGLFPGGNILNLIKDINDTINGPKQRVETANNFLNELDQFSRFGYSWSISVQLVIDLIDQLNSSDFESKKPNYKDASIRVQNRFNEVLNRLKNP